MALEHEFLLVTYNEYLNVLYDECYTELGDFSNQVLIHDDVIQYIQDTLNWIPSINPAMNYQKQFGLCNYGVTLFDKEGAEIILRLTKAWNELFLNGPATLKLTGNYGWITNELGITQGNYELIEVDRDTLIGGLEKLQLFSEKVIAGDYLILHRGI